MYLYFFRCMRMSDCILTGPNGNYMFNTLRNCLTIFQKGFVIYCPTSNIWVSWCLSILTELLMASLGSGKEWRACVRALDVHVCLDTCACVIQRSEEGVQCLTPPFFDLFFDTDTLTEPGALTIFLCSPHTPHPTVLGSREHSLTQLYMWCRDLNSGSRLHCKCS